MVASGMRSQRGPGVSDDVVPRKAAACITLSAIHKPSPWYERACQRSLAKGMGACDSHPTVEMFQQLTLFTRVPLDTPPNTYK